jgi:hypothetical protein
MIGGRRHFWGATTIKPIGTCNCPRRAGDGQLSVDKGVPSPGGQVSEMAGRGARVAVGLVLFGISSTSTRATTRHPGRTLGRIGQAVGMIGCARGGARSGLRQVEEMPNRLLVVVEVPGSGIGLLWTTGPPMSV